MSVQRRIGVFLRQQCRYASRAPEGSLCSSTACEKDVARDPSANKEEKVSFPLYIHCNLESCFEEEFRPLFIQPEHKLASQLQIERLTGRNFEPKRAHVDTGERMLVRFFGSIILAYLRNFSWKNQATSKCIWKIEQS